MQTYSYTVTMTEKDAYPRGWVIPAGYELTGEFRVPVYGDVFLHSSGTGTLVTANLAYNKDTARLIVRKIPTKKVITFRSAGVRPVKKGDWYQAYPGGSIWEAFCDYFQACQIFTRTETEE